MKKSAQSIQKDGSFGHLTWQIKYMLRDSSPSEELGRFVGEVVAVVVQQVISVRSCLLDMDGPHLTLLGLS